jgi:hypothetical protein
VTEHGWSFSEHSTLIGFPAGRDVKHAPTDILIDRIAAAIEYAEDTAHEVDAIDGVSVLFGQPGDSD